MWLLLSTCHRVNYVSIVTCLLWYNAARRKSRNEIRRRIGAFSVRVCLAMTFSTCRVCVWRMANYLSGRIEPEMSAFGSLKFHLECRNALNAVRLLSNATKERRVRTPLASLCHNVFDDRYDTLQRYMYVAESLRVNTLNQSAEASRKEVVTGGRGRKVEYVIQAEEWTHGWCLSLDGSHHNCFNGRSFFFVENKFFSPKRL